MANLGQRCRHPRHMAQRSFTQTGHRPRARGRREQPHARLAPGLAPGLPEHLHLGLVGVDYAAGQQQLLHASPQPGQPKLPGPHRLVGHVLARCRRAQALEVVFHAVQGKGVDVLAVEHVGDQRRRRERPLDGRGRPRRRRGPASRCRPPAARCRARAARPAPEGGRSARRRLCPFGPPWAYYPMSSQVRLCF